MQFQFRPRLIPTICVIVLTPALISLGFWQLDRARQKSDRMELYESRIASAATTVSAQMETPQDMEFRAVRATGVWDRSKEFLLDNQVLNSRAGYHVITPLILRDGKSAVLIDRGWIEANADRSILPQTPEIDEVGSVTGIAVIPPSDSFLLEKQNPIGRNWEQVWQALDLNRFRDAVDYRVHGFVVVLGPHHPDGFEYDWSLPADAWIIRHKAYAFQWFALATTLLVIYFVANTRRKGSPTKKTSS